MLNDILWPDHIQWQPPTDQTLYRTRPFTEFWVVSMEHLRRVWHADRGRLLPLDTWSYPIWDLHFVPSNRNHTTYLWRLPNMTFLTKFTLTNWRGFNRIYATGVTCQQGTLTPPDTWSRPFGTCICSTCWDQSFSELVVILPDYALRISLGNFSILLSDPKMYRYLFLVILNLCINANAVISPLPAFRGTLSLLTVCLSVRQNPHLMFQIKFEFCYAWPTFTGVIVFC